MIPSGPAVPTGRTFWLPPLLLAAGLALAAPVAAGEPPGRLAPVVPLEQAGPIFPILEPDMRATIQERFRAKLPEMKRQLADSLRTYRAPAFPRPTTHTARTILLDPSITVESDIVTPDGRVIARAGERHNPLRTIPMRRTYLVVNGADSRQLAWAARELAAVPTRLATILLTEGRLDAAMAAVPAGTRVFPAPAELFDRFSIESVPARLSRAGERLRIQFIAETDLQ
jgi:conjugal transfer pilus assembly protein TraW